jgi:glycosyltransferase involved in cell wall biosynthesis
VVSWFTYEDAYAEPPPFVQAKDGPQIAAAVERLLDDPDEAARIGEAGRAWVCKYHDAASMAERVEELAASFAR